MDLGLNYSGSWDRRSSRAQEFKTSQGNMVSEILSPKKKLNIFSPHPSPRAQELVVRDQSIILSGNPSLKLYL